MLLQLTRQALGRIGRQGCVLSGAVLLAAASLLLAENPEDSRQTTGLLWTSPITGDIEQHAVQSSALMVAARPALPTQPEDLAEINAFLRDETASVDESEAVEDVFGDVLEEIGVAPLPSDARRADETTSVQTPAATEPPAGAAQRSSAASSEALQSERVAASPEAQQAPAKVIPARVARLRQPIEECLRLYQPKMLNSGEQSCWSMMHDFLGWGRTREIRIGSSRGPTTNALNWLSQNQACAGRQLFYVSDGRIKGREGPGYQGHPAQFLAMAAQTDTPADHKLHVQGHEFTIAQLVQEEQFTCRESMELTFKLIGLSHYLDTDARWKNEQGQSWDMPRLMRAELGQPINGAACGGTHRIMGLTYALKKRKEANKPIEGQWWRAEKYVKDYYAYTMSLRNANGSFSSDWFKRRANWGGQDRKLQTSGHILEWMVFAAEDDQLLDDRMAQSVSFLVNLMVRHRYNDWEYGPKGHAVRALRLYHERVFGGNAIPPQQLVQKTPARQDGKTTVRRFRRQR